MRVRAKAMLKIDSILRTLDESDRKSVAKDVYLTYFQAEGVHKESTKPPGDVHKESTKQGETPGVSQDMASVVASNGDRHLSQEAKEVLQFLNEKTGKSYRSVETNLVLIRNCLKSGASSDDCRGVIARKVRQWKGTELEKYLRPATLFNRTKFEQYIGEQGSPS